MLSLVALTLFAAGPIDAAAASAALGLPAPAIAHIVRYRTAADQLSKAPSDVAFCALVDDAALLAHELSAPLSQRRDEGYAAEGAGSARRLDALDKALASLVNELPGIHLSNGAATFYAYRDNAALSTLAPTPAARALMMSIAPLTAAWPAWVTQLTDDQGCMNPKGAIDIVERVEHAWDAAPECLRATLAKDLKARLEWGTWFCEPPVAAKASVERLAKAMESFTAINGMEAATRLRASVMSKDARFGAAPQE